MVLVSKYTSVTLLTLQKEPEKKYWFYTIKNITPPRHYESRLVQQDNSSVIYISPNQLGRTKLGFVHEVLGHMAVSRGIRMNSRGVPNVTVQENASTFS